MAKQPEKNDPLDPSERLLLLSLLLETALVEEDFAEANRLFSARGSLISELTHIRPEHSQKIRTIEARTVARLRDGTVNVAKQLFGTMQAVRVARIYQNNPPPTMYDLAG